MPNLAALRAAIFLLSTKNRWGGTQPRTAPPPPAVRGLRPAPHGCVFHALRCVPSRCVHAYCIYLRGRIVTGRNVTHEKRIRVGRGVSRSISTKGETQQKDN